MHLVSIVSFSLTFLAKINWLQEKELLGFGILKWVKSTGCISGFICSSYWLLPSSLLKSVISVSRTMCLPGFRYTSYMIPALSSSCILFPSSFLKRWSSSWFCIQYSVLLTLIYFLWKIRSVYIYGFDHHFLSEGQILSSKPQTH